MSNSQHSGSQHSGYSATIEEFANQNNVNNDEAKLLIAYRASIRKLNALGAGNVVDGQFEFKQGIATKSAEIAQDGLGAVPVIGGLLAAGASVLKRIASFFEGKKIESQLNLVSQLSGNSPLVWNGFVEEVADTMMQLHKDEVIACKNKEEVRKLASSHHEGLKAIALNPLLVMDQTIEENRAPLLTLFTGAEQMKERPVAFSSNEKQPSAYDVEDPVGSALEQRQHPEALSR